MDFTNDQVFENELPSVLDVKYSPIHIKYRTVSIISTSIFVLIILTIAFIINIMSHDTWFYDQIRHILAAWMVLYSLLLISAYKGYAHRGYALRERDIIYKKGWLWQSTTVVPFNRIQHIEIDQGPIERMFSLSKLKIYTAGGASSDLTIPGLLPESANKLKDYIQLKVGQDEEE